MALKRKIVFYTILILALSVVGGILGCRPSARPDDVLEPNDDFEHATKLAADQAVTARANQNNDDYFAIDVAAGQKIIFRLQSLGLEDRPVFTVFSPVKEVLYKDRDDFSGPRQTESHTEGVTSEDIKDFGYELRIPAKISGTYYLLIRERPQADNIFPFSWDYRLIATIE
jgi:hypothetical protein